MFERNVSQILLIEDNALDADLILHALVKLEAGVALSVARDGEEALEYLKRWDEGMPTPVVILLDLQLPKISGFEVIKELKTHPRYRLLPIVVLTSSSNQDDIQTAYELGANSYILKSINYDLLTNAVSLIHRYWCGLNIHPE
jgi:CheY-like chemotaxis protein